MIWELVLWGVLANRLSVNPGISVLLLEADGPDRGPMLQIPGVYGKLFKTPFDWRFGRNHKRTLDGRIYLPLGKNLVGCS